ncbi:cytochrome P450 [Rhizoctonia solani]|nr:cytochrome P450 [Rhizoctonia solani]
MTLDAIQELLTTPVHSCPPPPRCSGIDTGFMGTLCSNSTHSASLPASEDYRMYARWGRELNSDIISITVFGQVIVVLNSAKAVNELLDRRSAIYSNRPELPMLNYPDLVDWSKEISTLPYGERWRSQRRMTHKALDKDANMQYGLLALKQSRLAAQRISANPDNFIREISRMTASTILSTVYGYEVTSAGDPLVEIVRVTVDHYCSAAVPGNFLVNVMPWLRHVPDWFPGTGWKQTVKAWRKEKDEMVDVPYGWTKKQIASGIAPHSIVQLLLSELENRPITGSDRAEEEDKIKWVAASLFVAGVDTSTASMIVFILAMTLNQNVLAKAQAEIDKVIGQDRLPDMSDRESLPYVECVMKEVLRWQPIAPTAAPHACTQDDEYNGYFIPKGAVVIGNVWAINYNESVYHKPAQFNPDRFLDPHVPKPSAFGFGRRSCPGVHLAESVLFSTMATFLALFDIRPAKDEKGNEIIPDVKMEWNALVSYPADFKCSITPRSEKAIQLLDLSTLEA